MTIKADQISDAISTVSGYFSKILELVPSTGISIDSITWDDVGTGGDKAEATFNVPINGDYIFIINISAKLNGGDSSNGQSIYHRLIFDEGEANEQTIEPSYDAIWGSTFKNQYSTNNYTFTSGVVTLTQGLHTILLQAKNKIASREVSIETDTGDHISIDVQSITGSGAGGTVVERKTATLNPQLIDTPLDTVGYEDIDGLSATIICSENESIGIFFRGSALPQSPYACSYNVRVDIDGINQYTLFTSTGVDNVAINLNSVLFTPILTSGTHVIKIQAAKISALVNWDLYSAELEIVRYRGGFIPYIDNNDVIIQDKPTSIKTGRGLQSINNDGQVILSLDYFLDDLNNSVIHPNWTQDIPVSGIISEDGSKLTISDVGGSNLNWWFGTNFDSPNVYLDILPRDFTAIVNISNITANQYNAGSLISYLTGNKSAFIRYDVAYDNTQYRVRSFYNSANENNEIIGQNNAWLAILRRGYKYLFLYSLAADTIEPNIDDFVFHRSIDVPIDYNNNKIVLAGITSNTEPAINIYFKKFRLYY